MMGQLDDVQLLADVLSSGYAIPPGAKVDPNVLTGLGYVVIEDDDW